MSVFVKNGVKPIRMLPINDFPDDPDGWRICVESMSGRGLVSGRALTIVDGAEVHARFDSEDAALAEIRFLGFEV